MQLYVPFVAALAGLVLFGGACAQPAPASSARPPDRPSDRPTGWVVDGRTGCKIRDDVPDPAEKVTWSGKCQSGMAEGTGTLQFYIGDTPATRYEGDMRNGRADGHGVSLEPGGARYEGAWRNNAADGYGVYTKDGTRYEGTWTAGCLKQGATELAVGVSRQSCGFK